ncbi:hypothetical protein EDD11_010171 [Mortierella claussenii]|nr:hypothetical protein EDD11_010171 [Mortierella claussenii]
MEECLSMTWRQKQKNTPREAAIYIVRLVNHKNMHVGMLALTLLDNCVKNCGHPFHLQIATKEFLNALVCKFPERPLRVPTPVQNRILEMIQEWYTTLCKTSRHKEDLIHIRDMHRLLAFKGYRFPPTKNTAATVLNPAETLKSAAELEEEDRMAQAAKLQELIRRGRPEDVRAANELVKRMTGYKQGEKPDYTQQVSADLNKILQKAVFLTEMLNEVKPGEIIGRMDIFEELHGICKAAHPKVIRFIENDEDHENMDTLLHLNSILASVLEQYDQVKNGNLAKVSLPDSVEHNDDSQHRKNINGNSVSKRYEAPLTPSQTKESSVAVNLLDFDNETASPHGSSSLPMTPKSTGSLMEDLMNLNFNDTSPPTSWGAAGSINLGQIQDINGNINYNNNNSGGNGMPSPTSPVLQNGGALNYNIFASPIAGISPVSVGYTSQKPTHSQLQPQKQQSPSSLLPSPLAEFEFVSNTGAPGSESGHFHAVLLNKNGLQIDLGIEKTYYPSSNNNDKVYKIKAFFSNAQSSPLTAFTFRVAVPKTLQLKLDPQSAQMVAPFSKQAVTQDMTIRVPADVITVRMRYHVSYTLQGRTIEEQGEFNQFP